MGDTIKVPPIYNCKYDIKKYLYDYYQLIN